MRGLRDQVGESELADHLTALHREVFLGASQRHAPTGPRDLQAHGDIGGRGGSKDVGIGPHVLADPAARRSAVAQRQADRVIRLAGKQHGGDFQAPAVKLEPDHVAVGQTQLPGRCRAHQRGVAPRELGDRVGELLEPAVVGVPAVIELGVAIEDQLEIRARQRRRARPGSGQSLGDLVPFQRRQLGGIGAGGGGSFVEELPPGGLEVGLGDTARLPERAADDLVG